MHKHMKLIGALTACPGLLLGCGDDFEPRTTLNGYRMLGVEAAPPEVTPDDSVVLTAHDFYDEEDPLEYSWSLCLYSLGSSVDFECLDKDLEFDLGDTQQVGVDLGPDGLDLRAQLDSYGPLSDAEGNVRDLETGFDFWVRLRSGPSECNSCAVDTVKRLRIRESNETPNENPVIEALSVQGTPHPGATVTLKLETVACYIKWLSSYPEAFVRKDRHRGLRKQGNRVV